MKLAMAQMAMSTDMAENLKKSLRFCEEAKGSDLLFFPEIQLCPFFPQYEKKNVDAYCLRSDAEEIRALSAAAGEGDGSAAELPEEPGTALQPEKATQTAGTSSSAARRTAHGMVWLNVFFMGQTSFMA